MLDLILVVNDPVKFHKRNLKINSSHYSALKYLGARSLAAVQDHWAARVYFNTLVPHNNGVNIRFLAFLDDVRTVERAL